MQKILQNSTIDLLNMLAKKEISAYELMQMHIDHIRKLNPLINAVEQMHAEEALAQASLADQRLARGEKLGKLHGLPVSIKDSMHVKGFKISRGSKIFYGPVSERDATVVKRLKDAGAIVLAVTNVPELLMRYETDNLIYGRTNNPYDLTRTPGGSSGGEAALIAACGSPLGIGSDFGGSLRVPAHNCGIATLKPTLTSIPATGNFPFDNYGQILDFATMGPMARYIKDISYVLPLLTGPDGYDPFTPPFQSMDPQQIDIKQLRIAYFSNDGLVDIDQDTEKTLQNVIQSLTGEVASIKYHQPELLKNARRLHLDITFFGDENGKGLINFFKNLSSADISPFMQQNIATAKSHHLSITELRKRLAEVTPFRFQFMREYYDFDIIICPVSTHAADLHGQSHFEDFSYSQLFSITGWPVAIVRCGTSKEGLPIAVQIAAKPWHDHLALAIAQYLENELGGWQMPKLQLSSNPSIVG